MDRVYGKPAGSDSVHPRRVTAGLGVVQVKILNVSGGEHPAYGGFQAATLRKIGLDHHSGRIETPQRDCPGAEYLGNFPGFGLRLLRGGTNVNRVTCLERRVGGLMFVMDEQDFFADLGILQADPAGSAGFLVNRLADRAVISQFLVGH
jgi:hypothetical protein